MLEVDDVIVKTVGRRLFACSAVALSVLSGGEVFAQGAGVIAGRVTECDCARPGVRIEAVGGGGEVRGLGVSDRDGRFRIEGLPAGVYEVFPDLDAFRVRERRRVDSRREQSVDFQIDHTLYGTVTLDGQRVGGRIVFMQLDDDGAGCQRACGARSGVTRQEDGTYKIENLPAGTYQVSVDGQKIEPVTLGDREWHSNEIALTSDPSPPEPAVRVETTTWAR